MASRTPKASTVKARRKLRERYKALAQAELQRYNAETPKDRQKIAHTNAEFERRILAALEKRKVREEKEQERKREADEARLARAIYSSKLLPLKETLTKEEKRKLSLAKKLLIAQQEKVKKEEASRLRTLSIFLLRLEGTTLKDVGAEHGVTRERVRQICAKELRRIKTIGRDRITEIMDDNKHKGRPFWYGLI